VLSLFLWCSIETNIILTVRFIWNTHINRNLFFHDVITWLFIRWILFTSHEKERSFILAIGSARWIRLWGSQVNSGQTEIVLRVSFWRVFWLFNFFYPSINLLWTLFHTIGESFSLRLLSRWGGELAKIVVTTLLFPIFYMSRRPEHLSSIARLRVLLLLFNFVKEFHRVHIWCQSSISKEICRSYTLF